MDETKKKQNRSISKQGKKKKERKGKGKTRVLRFEALKANKEPEASASKGNEKVIED
ncbi:hypothetical protein V6Z11_A05G047300 [Gossypium hirsutum]